jgi:hypothetical protein
MQDSDLAEARFLSLYKGSEESSQAEEQLAVLNAWVQHKQQAYRNLYHIVQAKRLQEILIRWGWPMDDPEAFQQHCARIIATANTTRSGDNKALAATPQR